MRRVAVITGASAGIGEAIAHRLAARRWLCVLVARREDRLRTLAEHLNGEYEVCDVGDREAIERMAAAVTERHPAIGMLVNNAGMPGRGDFTALDADRIELVTRVNYLGAVWATRAFMAALEAGKPSHIVNIVSVAGTVAWGPAGPYTASKHAALGFSRSLAAGLAPRGIAVHTINPGFVETETFPQGGLRNPVLRRLVIGPDAVAAAVMRAVDKNRREVFVPRWYRVPAIAQALAPGTLSRFMGGSAYRARDE
jgi:short-subunit dehydrogenase